MAERNKEHSENQASVEDAQIVEDAQVVEPDAAEEAAKAADEADLRPDEAYDRIEEAAAIAEAEQVGPHEQAAPDEDLTQEPPLDETAQDTDTASVPPAAAAPARSGGSFFGSLLTGLIGAVIGGGAVLFGGPLIGDKIPQDYAIARKTGVDAAIDAVREDLSGSLGQLGKKLDGLEAQTQTLASKEALATGLEQSRDAREGVKLEAAKAATNLQNEIDVLGKSVNKTESALRDQQDELGKELAALRDQIATLATATSANVQAGAGGEGAAAGDPGMLTRLALLEGRIRQLQGQIDALPRAVTDTPDYSRLELIEQRLTELENKPTVRAAENAAFGVAVSSLSQAVLGSAPFRSELEMVEKITGFKPPQALDALADTGLPSTPALAKRFEPAKRAALRAAAEAERAAKTEAEGETGVAGWLSSLVIVTSEDDLEGESPAAILNRAQERVEADDLHAALSELSALPAEAKAPLESWIKDASARVEAEAALKKLQTQLLQSN
ncbi:MAG: hypothetical protein MRY63_10880 [Neomegalonema sp.]|nr:hypothetical protein [Neomegalonema sp.]